MIFTDQVLSERTQAARSASASRLRGHLGGLDSCSEYSLSFVNLISGTEPDVGAIERALEIPCPVHRGLIYLLYGLLEAGRYDDLLRIGGQALASGEADGPSSLGTTKLLLAFAHFHKREYSRAIKRFSQFSELGIEVPPLYMKTCFALAAAYLNTGQAAQAAHVIAAAKARRGRLPRTFAPLVKALLREGHLV